MDDAVRADVLGNATGLAGRDLGLTNGVEKGGLAVVDVAEDGDDGRAGDEVFALFGGVHLTPCLRRFGPQGLLFRSGNCAGGLGFEAHLFDHDRRRVEVDLLVDGRHDAVGDQALHHFDRAGLNHFGQLPNTKIIGYQYYLFFLSHTCLPYRTMGQEKGI